MIEKIRESTKRVIEEKIDKIEKLKDACRIERVKKKN